MEGVDDIFDALLQYEMQNNLQDVAAPDEMEDIQLMQYVDNTDGLCPDVLGYCTRDNIDHFFLNWISKRTTSPAVNRCFVSAIQKYSDFWEDRPGA